jgi:hypothetical protein
VPGTPALAIEAVQLAPRTCERVLDATAVRATTPMLHDPGCARSREAVNTHPYLDLAGGERQLTSRRTMLAVVTLTPASSCTSARRPSAATS